MTRLYTWLLALSFLLLTSPAMPGMKGAARDAYDSHRCENFFNSARPLWEFSANLNSSKLAVEIAARRKRVREFQLIAEEAKNAGCAPGYLEEQQQVTAITSNGTFCEKMATHIFNQTALTTITPISIALRKI